MTTRRANTKKEHRQSIRLPDADIAIIDRAAGMRGQSRTDFVREAAVRAAEDVLMESTLIRMSPSGFNTFLKALAEPSEPLGFVEAQVWNGARLDLVYGLSGQTAEGRNPRLTQTHLGAPCAQGLPEFLDRTHADMVAAAAMSNIYDITTARRAGRMILSRCSALHYNA